ncbi:MAG TPA: tripartite tricarboxylate transporter substrate binding protein [Streptosporangiaceae bacterium]|jgi:putative tricarboxylic transport membrane protein
MAAAVCVVVAAGAAAGCNGTGSGGAGGGAWRPTRPVTLDVPFAPGGGSDIFGRALQAGIKAVQPNVNVNVVNKPGGSGSIGYSYLFEQQGSPYTLVPSESTSVALPLTTKTPWKWTDFTPIMQIGEDVVMLVVPASSPYKDLKSVVAAAKSGKALRMGVSGTTGPDAVDEMLMQRQKGIKFNQVVVESGGEMVTSLLGGDIDMGMLNPSEVIGQVQAGKLRAIAVFAKKRYTKAPLDSVPTAKEQGVNVAFTQYRGVFAAGGITKAQQKYWEDTVGKWTKTPGYKRYVDSAFLNPVQRGHDAFVTYLKDTENQLKAAYGKNGS